MPLLASGSDLSRRLRRLLSGDDHDIWSLDCRGSSLTGEGRGAVSVEAAVDVEADRDIQRSLVVCMISEVTSQSAPIRQGRAIGSGRKRNRSSLESLHSL